MLLIDLAEALNTGIRVTYYTEGKYAASFHPENIFEENGASESNVVGVGSTARQALKDLVSAAASKTLVNKTSNLRMISPKRIGVGSLFVDTEGYR